MSSTFELAIVAVLRNEAAYVEEWIAYHTVAGVEHFYLYENNSDDDIRSVLKRYITHGLVTMIEFPMGGPQVPAYRHAIHCFGASTGWLAPLDLDEFIVPKVDSDIPAMLHRLGDADRVVLPWRNFGFSGHRTRPPGLVIENFVLAEDVPEGGFARMPVKTIVRPELVVSVGTHTPSISSDRTVDADGSNPEMVEVKLVRPSYRSGQVNHYVTKSEAEYVAKNARGEVNRNLPRRNYTLEEEHGFSTPDRSIERFVEPTRQRLEEHRALSPSPFRYGSQVRMRIPHPDPFLHHVTLAVSNYLHGMRITRNGTNPIPNIASGDLRAYVARAEDSHRGPGMWRFSESPHFPDLVRRLEAEVHWHLDEATALSVETPLVLPTATQGQLLHLTFAAIVRSDEPAVVRWSAHSEGPLEHVETALPSGGRYVCVVEANRHLARCDAAVVDVRAGGPITVEELFVVSYG